jgi:carboxyl-terminal processing protease
MKAFRIDNTRTSCWARSVLLLLLLLPICDGFLQRRIQGHMQREINDNLDTSLTTLYLARPHDDRQQEIFHGRLSKPPKSISHVERDVDDDYRSSRTGLAHQLSAIAVASAIVFSSIFGPSLPPARASELTVPPSPIEITTLLSSENSVPSAQQVEQDSVVNEVWSLIDKYFIDRTFNNQDWNKAKEKAMKNAEAINFDNDKTMKIIGEMVGSLNDKYTRILDVQQYAAIQKFDLIGVGVTLMPNAQKDIIVGAPPIGGSPSSIAGLKVGDYVTAVNGRPTRGRSAFDIIDQIGEDPNAKTVSFSILRKDNPMESSLTSIGDDTRITSFDVTMDRQTQEMKDPVSYKISETRKDGTVVGYVRITEFNSLVNSSLQRALARLREEGANAYVMDLRANTGGAFQSAVEISGMFLRDRVATYVVDSNRVELPFRTPKMQELAVDPQAPLVIWLDGMSASASEVLAGSLHDNCRAVTMGDKSFGKGLIQAVYGLKNGAGLVLTVARYITPSGYEIQGKGITPDLVGNMAPIYVPVLSSDTSKVDFGEISKRLDSSFCKLPEERLASTAASGSLLESSN